jgi:hypothetical protein
VVKCGRVSDNIEPLLHTLNFVLIERHRVLS